VIRAATAEPVVRHALREAPEFGIVDLLKPGQRRFKRLPADNLDTNAVPAKDARKGASGKSQLPALKQYPWVRHEVDSTIVQHGSTMEMNLRFRPQ
jgi:hypothetical protein